MEPTFKVGDKVEFELAHNGDPCWDFETAKEGTGEWETGTVTTVDTIRITVTSDKDCLYWRWPLKDHPKYTSNQWERPGYLRHVEEKTMNQETVTTWIVCCKNPYDEIETYSYQTKEGAEEGLLQLKEEFPLEKFSEVAELTVPVYSVLSKEEQFKKDATNTIEALYEAIVCQDLLEEGEMTPAPVVEQWDISKKAANDFFNKYGK